MSELFKQLLSPIETLDPYILTAAADRHRIDVDAEFIVIESADEAVDVFLNKSTRPLKMSANDFYRMPSVDGVQTRFTQIEIKRRAGATVAANTVTISIGSGEYRRGTTTIAATVRVTRPSNLLTPADVVLGAATNTLLFAANANATRRTIRNTHATVDLRVSTTVADLTAGRGKLVKAGEEWETDVSGALYGRSTGTPTLVLAEESF